MEVKMPGMPKPVQEKLEWIDEQELDFARKQTISWLYRPVHPIEIKKHELASLFIAFPECPGCKNCAKYAITVFKPGLGGERIRVYTPKIAHPDEVLPGITRVMQAETEDEWNWTLEHLEPIENPCRGGDF